MTSPRARVFRVLAGATPPVLAHPGRGRQWWKVPGHIAWSDPAALWLFDLSRRDEVLRVDLEHTVGVEAGPSGELFAWSVDGGSVRVPRADRRGSSGSVQFHTAPSGLPGHGLPIGLDARVSREEGRWKAHTALGPLELPEGARAAFRIAPFRRGNGVVWQGDGWTYRLRAGGVPAVVGAQGERSFEVGPEGAVLLGGGMARTHGAAPDRRARLLPEALVRADWGVRWSADGRVVAGVRADDALVRIDLVAASILQTVRAALPLDAEGAFLGVDGRIVGFEPPGPWRPREHSTAVHGELLGGPGGVVWDLAAGTPLFTNPALAYGATVATAGAWATADWESGDGWWLDPRTGTRLGAFRIPLCEGDLVERGHPEGKDAIFRTAEGRRFRVREGGPPREETPVGREPEDGDAAEESRRREVAIAVLGAEEFGRLGFERTALVRGRLWGFDDDGLLVELARGI